jgi:hypothetical protein
MCLISIRATGLTLARIVSNSAVRIALSAILTTPQPTVALQAVIDAPGGRSAPLVRLAEPTQGNGGAAAVLDKPAPTSGFVDAEPGLGWG